MNIGILGTGAYGIALAKVLEKNNEIRMWTKFKEEADDVSSLRENKKLLPGVKISKDTLVTTDIEKCILDADIIFIAVPVSAFREVVNSLKKIVKKSQIICITSKGIEQNTGMFPRTILENVLEDARLVVVSGPSFAIEFASGAEVGLSIASRDAKAAEKVLDAFDRTSVTLETLDDVIGVEVLAATKNIYAILMGMLEGTNASDSTKASVLTCVINDTKKIVEVFGGNKLSEMTFAGIGDLFLTCTSDKSRNFMLGEKIASGLSVNEALESMNTSTVEGLYSLEVIKELLDKREARIKSIDFIYSVLYEKKALTNVLKNMI